MKVSGSACLAALLFLAAAPAAAQLPSVDLSQPISAEEAVRLALERNYGIRVSEDIRDQSRASVTSAWGGLTPSLTAGWDYTHSKSTGGLFPTETDSRGYFINANQNLLSLPVFLNIAAQKRYSGAAESEVDDAEQLAAFGVRQQYYRLIEAIKLLQVRQEDRRLAAEEQRRTESLFEVGSVARTDVLKARVRVAEAQSALTAAENTAELEKSRLAQALALPTNADLRVTENLDPRTDLPDSTAAYQVALDNRPDLRALRQRVRAAGSDRKAALTSKLPYLSHSYTRNFSRSSGDDFVFDFEADPPTIDREFVRRTSGSWSYQIGFTWNILDRLVTESNIQRTSAQQRQLEHQAEELELQVGLDVKEALLLVRNAGQQIVSAREGLASAEEDLNLSQERYSVGLGTILELIDAQVALTRARSAEVQAMAALKIAEAQLDRAMGRVTW